MDRRSFLKNSALGGTAAAATTLAAPAVAQGTRTLTLVTSVPEGFAIFDDAAQHFVDNVNAMSDGALTIDKKPAGSLVGAFEVFDAVTAGQADMYHSKEINSAADLQGLKFRMPGLGGKALGLTGASVQNVPGGEIYQALSTGAIDGAEWIGPFADERLGLQEVCDYYYTGGFHEPGSPLTAHSLHSVTAAKSRVKIKL